MNVVPAEHGRCMLESIPGLPPLSSTRYDVPTRRTAASRARVANDGVVVRRLPSRAGPTTESTTYVAVVPCIVDESTDERLVPDGGTADSAPRSDEADRQRNAQHQQEGRPEPAHDAGLSVTLHHGDTTVRTPAPVPHERREHGQHDHRRECEEEHRVVQPREVGGVDRRAVDVGRAAVAATVLAS